MDPPKGQAIAPAAISSEPRAFGFLVSAPSLPRQEAS
jgi:hypothetical protein